MHRMFSERSRFDLTRNRLSAILDAKRLSGARLLDLTLSNPTRAGIARPEDLLATLADPGNRLYEPAAAGLAEARQAVALDYRRRGQSVAPERILLTASTSEAYAFLFKVLCDPDDVVLVPCPGYPLFGFLARLESLRVAHYPLVYDGEWHLPCAEVEASLLPRTRALVVVNPNNPTGSYLKADEAEKLQTLCAERGVALISDEVFSDYSFAPDARRVRSLATDGPALTFSLGGLSKSTGLPQLKLAWIAVFGPEPLRAQALERLELVADTFLSVGTPVQRALKHLLARLPELQAPIAGRVRANRDWLVERLRGGSAATLLQAEGGWYAVLQVTATMSEEERVCRLLELQNVLVHPGFFFDFPHEAYLVLSLLPEEEVFRRAVELLLATC